MREIKFRGKSLTLDNRWIYGSYLTRINSRGGQEHLIVELNGNEFPIDIKTLGQFTEPHDKNGKEIYEGDIMQYRDEQKKEYGDNFVVAKMNNDYLIENWTIVGNIYENKDLLK
ncbi:MAG: hypothetical protein GWP06_12510 [Actinobacteria bacterium]|nr:hypothetical protein [Actinomycetota bacterium]